MVTMQKIISMPAIIIFLLLSFTVSGQSLPDSSNKFSDNNINMDIHIGYGTFAGGRIGIRFYLAQNVSLEASLGLPWGSFLSGPADERNITNVGVNWQPKMYRVSKLTLSLNIIHDDYVLSGFNDHLAISPSVGIMNFSHSGINFWGRAGFSTRIYNLSEKQFRLYHSCINLDIGISITIF